MPSLDVAACLECVHFLYREALALDDRRLRDWLSLLTDDIDYRVPVRLTREDSPEGDFSDKGFLMLEDRASLEAKVRRFETEYAWAENPPSRTRRMVGNVLVGAGERADEVVARNNLMLFRSRGDSPEYDLICGQRLDTLRRADGGWKLARRVVLLDHTTLGTLNLSIFL